MYMETAGEPRRFFQAVNQSPDQDFIAGRRSGREAGSRSLSGTGPVTVLYLSLQKQVRLIN